MKLEFKILWFDDQPNELNAAKEMLQRHLARQGFKLTVKEIDIVRDIQALLPQLDTESSPDLIMMDWNMGNGTNGEGLDGSDIAKAIRRRFKYQEIIFYSAATLVELREAVFNKNIDGVFCVDRRILGAETIEVITTILRKVVDINQMRGIVMSHVSEFDVKISECLSDLHAEGDDDLKQRILDELYQVIEKFHEGQLRKITENRASYTLKNYEKLSVLDTRYGILKKLLTELASDGRIDAILETLNEFRGEVLKPRNALAHAKEVQENGKAILKHDSDTYDDRRLSQLRQNLLAHEDNLHLIHESILNGHFTPTCTD